MIPAVLDLSDCARAPATQIGGKALGLGRLLSLSLDVPAGFVVTTGVFTDWMRAHGLDTEVRRLLASAEGLAGSRAAAVRISELLAAHPLRSDAIDAAYARLGADGDAPVAVRSSATGEDGATSSYAGQQETFLWVRGSDQVRRRIVECWASLFSGEALAYRRHLGVSREEGEMAVVVQRMVPAEAAGVMFTVDPLTGDPSQITIESTVGLGTPLVSGEVTPDRYCVDKVTLELRSRTIATKRFAERLDPVLGETRRMPLSSAERSASSLTDDEVARLAQVGRQLEHASGVPMDVEWALCPAEGAARHLYLLQARPETGRRAAAAKRPGGSGAGSAVEQMFRGLRSRR